jgi:hypothetical protein
MTSGQHRALLELRRLHAAEPDGFTIVDEPRLVGGSLVTKVAIRLGSIESAEGGLELREREEFVLHVPPGCPFDRPRLSVEHDRFAGFSHVTWVHAICLYRSTADWNPRDGLYGFFEQLRVWLWKAAINDMDPGDAPLEPPHHVTAFSQVPFVIRANVPVQAGEGWAGLAQLEKHPNRIELVGWSEFQDDWPAGREAALALILQKPLPMEFPRNGQDFFRELGKQDVGRDMVIRLLACAATLTAPDDPIHLVVGLPMRRAADGSSRLHVAVWTTSSAFATALRLTLEEEDDSSSMQEIRKDLADAIYALLETDEIAWCQILEDRPEIVVRRDQSSAASWFLGKRVLLLGCGALGSWIGESVARAGAASIDLLDNAIVKPGLLARQNFTLADIGARKAEALAGRLRSVSMATQSEHFHRDAHAFIMEDPARFQKYDVVIDCTASSIAQMKLERDWGRLTRATPPMISMGIDAHSQRCLAVTIPRNAVGGVWDAYLQLKHRLCVANTNREILESFYSERAAEDLMQPEPGCSDPTFCGSAADVAGLAAFALNMAVAQLDGNDLPCGMAFSSPGHGTARLAADVVQLMNLEEVRAGQYRIRVARNVHREARGWVLQSNRKRSADHETGGLLWGLWDDAVEVIWLFDASGPPADSRHDAGRFVCGVEGTADEHKRRSSLTRGVCGFVGMWHTHPEMPAAQSATDIAGMATLVAGVGQNQRRALMLIYGRAAAQPMADFFAYDSQARGKALELISVGIGHVLLETAVV